MLCSLNFAAKVQKILQIYNIFSTFANQMRKIIAYMNAFRPIQLLILLPVFLIFMGCRTQQLSQSPYRPITPSPDTTVLPTFPDQVLYVLGAQWEADTLLQQEQTIADYIEQELIRLYPEKAYRGYVARLCSVADRLLTDAQQSPTLFVPKRQEISFAPSPISNSPYPIANIPSHSGSILGSIGHISLDSLSLIEELQLLEFTPQEQVEWECLQSLVDSEQLLTRESFDTLNISYFEEENILLTLLLWRGPRLFYRVLQSKARAEKLAYYYYGEATNNGRPGDAFKHIYVNVLLRTYVGEWISHAIMDVFWEWKSPNAPCDYYMDMHNNIIGRQTRYADFTTIDTQCHADMRHWLQWAENVQHFIQDSVNGDFQGWDKETPTFIVEPAAKQVSDTQYIYWDK